MDLIIWLGCTIGAGVLAYYGARWLALRWPRLRTALITLTLLGGFVIIGFIDTEPPHQTTTWRDGTALPFSLAMLAWAVRAALFGGMFGAINARAQR